MIAITRPLQVNKQVTSHHIASHRIRNSEAEEDEPVRIEELLDPSDRLSVQMVCWLICATAAAAAARNRLQSYETNAAGTSTRTEQQNVRFGQQQPAQRHTTSLALRRIISISTSKTIRHTPERLCTSDWPGGHLNDRNHREFGSRSGCLRAFMAISTLCFRSQQLSSSI